jgi:hypothetical protein
MILLAASLALSATLELNPTPCALEGGPLVPDGERVNVSVAAGAEGSVFLYHRPLPGGDSAHRVERWDVESHSDRCTLTHNATFAGDGQLERPGIFGLLAVVGDKLVVGDRENTVYDLDGNPLYVCDDIGRRTRAHPIDDSTALVTNGSRAIERWTFNDDSCSHETLWELPEKHQVSYHFGVVDGDVAGLYLLPGGAKSLVRFGEDGVERWRYGSVESEHKIKSVAAVASLAGHLVFNDAFPTTLSALDGDGHKVAELAYRDRFASLRSWQVQHLIPVGEHQALLFLTHVDDTGVHGQFHTVVLNDSP